MGKIGNIKNIKSVVLIVMVIGQVEFSYPDHLFI